MDPYVTNNQNASSQTASQNAVNDPYVISSPQAASPTISDQYNDPYSIAPPKDVTSALSQNGNQDDNGECQKFVEQMVYGHSGIFTSAINAWDSYVQAGDARAGIKGAKPGDLIYFAPDKSNQQDGHTGIYTGNNQFVSATDNGVMPYDLHDWQQRTGQQILGYIPIQGGKN